MKRGIEVKQNLNKNYDYDKYENKKIVMKKIKYSTVNELKKKLILKKY